MSVQTEITRISGAKSDIATAITNKGVTVPSGTKLDGMAALIDSISGGGGSKKTVTVSSICNTRAGISYLNSDGTFTDTNTSGNYEALGGIFYIVQNTGIIISTDATLLLTLYSAKNSLALTYKIYCATTDGASVIVSTSGGTDV